MIYWILMFGLFFCWDSGLGVGFIRTNLLDLVIALWRLKKWCANAKEVFFQMTNFYLLTSYILLLLSLFNSRLFTLPLRWVEAMKWSGQDNYLAAPTVPFTVDGLEAKLQKKYGPLIFLKVHNANYLVPMDQPKAALDMIQRWLQGKLWKVQHSSLSSPLRRMWWITWNTSWNASSQSLYWSIYSTATYWFASGSQADIKIDVNGC